MKAKIEMKVGDEAIRTSRNPNFQSSWKNLYKNTKVATVFQAPEFVVPWYELNSEGYTPLLVTYVLDETLVGILCLALIGDSKSGNFGKNVKIVGAGEYDAEYQVWLVDPAFEEDFLTDAMGKIFAKFSKAKLSFRFIPTLACLNWITENKEWSNRAVIQPYHRPLMQIDHPNFADLYKKRHFKAKYNRFNRAGICTLDEITDFAEFEEVYNEVIVLLDFRQGALFNKIPSKKNPNQKRLFQELFKENLLHVTVLRLDGKLTSCIIGMKSGEWMHLSGLITYSPFYSKLSPSLVHLFLLGKLLEEQGYKYFDLTPGDDGYKERMATNADEVFEVSITQDSKYKIKRELRKRFHAILLKRGIRPMSFDLNMKRFKYDLQAKIRGLTKSVKSNENVTTPIPKFIPEEINFEVNNIAHLLKYDEIGGLPKWNFLSNCFANIEAGNSFITFVAAGTLLTCAWIPNPVSEETNEELTKTAMDTCITYFHPGVLDQKDKIIAALEENIQKT